MKKGNLLLIIITLIIIIIVCIFALLISLRKQGTKPPVVQTYSGEQITEVTDRNNYYMVENCVNKFYKYYALIYQDKAEEDIEKLYSLLDQKYIDFKNLTKENILTVLPKIEEPVINISNMYMSKQTDNISVYLVTGILREKIIKELSNFQIMIQINTDNQTFSVVLQDYIEQKYKDLNIGSNLLIQPLYNIKQNRYNLYFWEEVLDSTYAVDLFNKYKEEALYNIELAYESLDEEYRNQKFGTLGAFQEYVVNNKERISTTQISKYQKTEREGYTQYICVDKNGYYYIFRETGLKKYTLLLDTYTIDLPEFVEKYNNSNTVERVGYNIQKCLDAINYEDYAYVYNKLDFEFKAINYPILENFEKAIKTNLFSRNKVKSVTSYSEGSTYIYKLTIIDEEDNTKEKNMTVVMQLKDKTDFVMSLSFE